MIVGQIQVCVWQIHKFEFTIVQLLQSRCASPDNTDTDTLCLKIKNFYLAGCITVFTPLSHNQTTNSSIDLIHSFQSVITLIFL